MHRGSYSDSMTTEQEVENTKEAIFNYITIQTELHELVGPEDIEVRFYANTPDRQWEQDYIIMGLGVPYAFCSEPVA